MDVRFALAELTVRCDDDHLQAGQRLMNGALSGTGRTAMQVEPREFNCMSEAFYRQGLRRQHLSEALEHLKQDLAEFERGASGDWRVLIRHGVRVQDPIRFLEGIRERVLTDQVNVHETTALLNLLLLLVAHDEDPKGVKET